MVHDRDLKYLEHRKKDLEHYIKHTLERLKNKHGKMFYGTLQNCLNHAISKALDIDDLIIKLNK